MKSTLVQLQLSLLLGLAHSELAPASEPLASAPTYTKNVAVVLYDGVELLDFAGPGEVFTAAAGIAADRGMRAFHVYTVAISKERLVSQGLVSINPEYSIADAPTPDIVVIPGGNSRVLSDSAPFMDWIKRLPASRKVLTVCTGAFIPARLGWLDGLTTTTHFGAIAGLKQLAPKANVIEGTRFVDNDWLINTAGVSAGIDGALHLVARLLGRQVADAVAQYMEYHWSPDAYLAQSYVHENPQLDRIGQERSRADSLSGGSDRAAALAAWKELIEVAPNEAYHWYRYARELVQGGKLGAGIDALNRALSAPLTNDFTRSRSYYDLAAIYANQKQTSLALDAIEKAVAAGFDDRRTLKGDTDLDPIREEPRFKKLLGSL